MKQRTIKFRAWDSNRKVMKTWENLCLDGDMDYGDILKGEHGFIPMQFTGLLDKNGKEIYEGDILKSETGYQDKRGYTEVKWKTFEDVEYECGIGIGFNIHPDGTKDIEIIGNIYENPELLK